MPGLMNGKRGLVIGVANDHSIAWGIAKTLAAHGATLAFTYQGDALAARQAAGQSVGSSFVMPCDVEDIATVSASSTAAKANGAGSIFWSTPIAFSDKSELKGRLREVHARELHSHHGDLLLRLHRGGQARRGADAERRLDGDADL